MQVLSTQSSSSLGAAPGHVSMTYSAHGKVVLGWWDGYPFVPSLMPSFEKLDNSEEDKLLKGAGS